jgi:FkbM family methyltransferase
MHALVDYYVANRAEFYAEAGHEKLLVGLKKFVTPCPDDGRTVLGIDVGCCVGDYLPHIRDICIETNRVIYCFEPNPVNLATLEPKIQQDSGFRLFKLCVSNENTTASLYDWKGQTNTTGNGLAGLRSGGEKICDVEVRRLDDIIDEQCGEQSDAIIKFIKVDTEGNDGNVIKGLERYLPNTRYIVFECSDCLDDHRGPGIPNPMADIVQFLSMHGFDTYRIGTKKLLKVNDEFWSQVYDDVKFWSNFFALKKDDDLIHKLIDETFAYRY